MGKLEEGLDGLRTRLGDLAQRADELRENPLVQAAYLGGGLEVET